MLDRSGQTPQPATIHLKDYQPPAYLVDAVDLHFALDEQCTTATARLALRRNPARADAPPLRLDGQDLELVSLRLDGRALAPHEYRVEEEALEIPAAPEQCTLEVVTRTRPAENTALEGLYASGGNLCTQCEAEGFRRITYYPDRPDVMARYTVTLSAERARYPVLLANGNLVAQGEERDGTHWARWEDPFPKPSYLFALVAGDLVRIEDRYTTASGREVALHIYVQAHNADKCEHAMASLKQAMRWDEEVFGREYDLDVYMIVAVDDFNMGAMENKGLNIFNSKYVLARPDTATDRDYEGIQGVIGHEYFHNWSGNRVTCRDWFQLSLKEGLTVFRDQQFSGDMNSRAVKRIDDVTLLRTHQFAEDAGPMAHPVRPQSYIEINNFYTVTVYEKGAEVVRMIHTLLGPERFRRGMDLYFERHDGQAVTTDDFVQAMQDASEVDLSQFRRWYDQAGTPVLRVQGAYDAPARRYTLAVEQHTPPTPDQPDKQPLHIPLALGLVGPDGQDLPLRLQGEAAGQGTRRVVDVRAARETFVFEDVPAEPIPSLLRGYSAPVRLDYDYTDEALAFLLAHDSDPFARWEAGQQLAVRLIMARVVAPQAQDGAEVLAAAYGRLLEDSAADPAFAARALALPSEEYLAQLIPYRDLEHVDPEALHGARHAVKLALATALAERWQAVYEACGATGPYRYVAADAGQRSLRAQCLSYLVARGGRDGVTLAWRQFREADNMTDSLAALAQLVHTEAPERDQALAAFYARWQDDSLVLDKWFALQAGSERPDTLAQVRALLEHPAFSLRNPNKVRALIGTFCHRNPLRFHDVSGEGYAFLREQVLQLAPRNPQVAARLVSAFNQWRHYDAPRQALMRAELERILSAPALPKDVHEIAGKALGNGAGDAGAGSSS
ncbi:aminopeptidase N [Ectothiorhodospiraceae bacterium 2226]|nr:aminopeptidase N [Ectothiorhodospiraceae bacterium 2226]